MKVYDTINPREGLVIGDAADESAALKLLKAHFVGTGEDRLYGVARADFNADFTGEVFIPRLKGLN
jgi:hypothetical protein